MRKSLSQFFESTCVNMCVAALCLSILVAGMCVTEDQLSMAVEDIESLADIETSRNIDADKLICNLVSSSSLSVHLQNLLTTPSHINKSQSEYVSFPADRMQDHRPKTGPPSLVSDAKCTKAFSGHHSRETLYAGNEPSPQNRFSIDC